MVVDHQSSQLNDQQTPAELTQLGDRLLKESNLAENFCQTLVQEDAVQRNTSVETRLASAAELFAEAKLLEETGAVVKATAIYQQLVAQYPQIASYQYRLAEALVRQGDLAAAVTHLLRAVELRSDSWFFQLRLGEMLWQQQDFERAILAFQQAIALNPQSYKAYRQLGELLWQQGRSAEAIDSYRRLADLQPSFNIYSRLSEWLIQNQQLNEAVRALEAMLRFRPNYPKAYVQLGSVLTQLNRYDAALDCYQRLIEINAAADRVVFDSRPGDCFVQQGVLDAAITYYQTVLRFAPQESRAYYALGLIYEQQQNWRQSLDCLLKALEYSPSYIKVYPALIRVAERYGQSTGKADFTLGNGDIPSSILRQFRTATEWAVLTELPLEGGCSHYPVLPAAEFKLPEPRSVEAELHSSFAEADCKVAPADVIVVENGRGYADHWTSAVITQSNQLLSMVSTGRANLIVSSDHLPDPVYLKGNVAFLSARLGSRCYYHWMLEVLPRFELLRMAGLSLDAIDQFVLLNCRARFCQESLQALGVPLTKVMDSLDYPVVQAERLVVPTVVGNFKATPWLANFLKQTFLPDPSISGRKRIYISRRKASKRKISNEAEVSELLEQHGFESVIMESLSLAEQAALMTQAEAVVSMHGSGITNTVFCRAGTKVIELFSPTYVNPCYWTMCSALSMDYYYLIGLPPDEADIRTATKTVPAGSQNTWIDLENLRRLMSLAKL